MSAEAGSKVKVEACLIINCAGPFSKPEPRQCDESVAIRFPIELEGLTRLLMGYGWFVTVASGESVDSGDSLHAYSVLCPQCAAALLPTDVVATARSMMAKGQPN